MRITDADLIGLMNKWYRMHYTKGFSSVHSFPKVLTTVMWKRNFYYELHQVFVYEDLEAVDL